MNGSETMQEVQVISMVGPVRRSVAVLCVLLMAAASVAGLKRWQDSRIPALESLSVVEGRVLQPARPCRGVKMQVFDLIVLVGQEYRTLVLSCDRRLFTSAVGGTNVVLGLQAEKSGPPRWRVWMASVDGLEVIPYFSVQPWSPLHLVAFLIFALVYSPVVLIAGKVRFHRLNSPAR